MLLLHHYHHVLHSFPQMSYIQRAESILGDPVGFPKGKRSKTMLFSQEKCRNENYIICQKCHGVTFILFLIDWACFLFFFYLWMQREEVSPTVEGFHFSWLWKEVALINFMSADYASLKPPQKLKCFWQTGPMKYFHHR